MADRWKERPFVFTPSLPSDGDGGNRSVFAEGMVMFARKFPIIRSHIFCLSTATTFGTFMSCWVINTIFLATVTLQAAALAAPLFQFFLGKPVEAVQYVSLARQPPACALGIGSGARTTAPDDDTTMFT